MNFLTTFYSYLYKNNVFILEYTFDDMYLFLFYYIKYYIIIFTNVYYLIFTNMQTFYEFCFDINILNYILFIFVFLL